MMQSKSFNEILSISLELAKPRVMILSIFTAFCGMVLAPGSLDSFRVLVSMGAISIGAGGAGCLNMWYDQDIDQLMERTRKRPLPQGRISSRYAFLYGLTLSLLSIGILWNFINLLSAILLAVTIGIYVIIYTLWLKRSTPQNIVIGGIAGALPPVIGWAAQTGDISFLPLTLFLFIFLWTPAHFWALSLYRQDDYNVANIPMMPLVKGIKSTKKQILLYALLTVISSFLPFIYGIGSTVYLISAAGLGYFFLTLSYHVYESDDPKKATQLFLYSILYLFLIFLILTLDHWRQK